MPLPLSLRSFTKSGIGPFCRVMLDYANFEKHNVRKSIWQIGIVTKLLDIFIFLAYAISYFISSRNYTVNLESQ